MADGAKRTGGEPVFDTDRAWERFERLAAREPVPAFWRLAEEDRRTDETRIEARLDGNQNDHEKDGALEMKQTGEFRVTQGAPVVGGTGVEKATGANGADGTWRTERPAKRRLRRLTAGVAAAVIAIGLITTPLGDRALAAMMQTFRIQHMVGVGITADDMAAISSLLDRGSPDGDRSFNLAQYGTLTQSGGGKARTVTWEEAKKRMGAPLLQLGNPTAPAYQPATTLTFHLNVKAVNRLLTRLGSTTTLPAEADGKAIRLHIPDGITTEGTLSGKPVRLLQFGKPELTVEGGIDAATVREAVLGLPVLPDSLRTKLAAIGDWRSTLPVPVQDGVTTSLRLGGHDAIMTLDGSNRYLLWLDGERIGLLSGDMNDFPMESTFQRAAEELVQS
ncbi:hypothetical protein [Paenibacillus beijingensis]|uniref:DUF4367 domain-containing protein n=1 Tax=Paenibacillus beijingensis TaxID=1126833 RepID=A0A0D5NMZ9_9BACL|nr:hypothetical protein [Paenibacillus beijingensis]AJY76674.1 hypothetical protein VN24_21500 [Paenibacillus beijingensis]